VSGQDLLRLQAVLIKFVGVPEEGRVQVEDGILKERETSCIDQAVNFRIGRSFFSNEYFYSSFF